ncbi:MAG: hypothetical protein OES79_07720, partial [Planctomycetota bacterium]|nr:hypothetical protein [Planctomycetota bacterium]
GVSAAWKVRAQGAARDAVWQVLWPRNADKPHPSGWPATASLDLASFQEQMLDIPALQQPVVRGPQIGNIDVDSTLLDPARGGRDGKASIERPRPLLPLLGDMRYDVNHPLIDDTWTYQQTQLNANVSRRIKVLYDMHESEMGEWSAYGSAVDQVENALQQTNLLPLTFWLTAWGGGQRHQDPDFPRFNATSPDFHPHLQSFTTLDPEWVRQHRVVPLIAAIADDDQQVGDASVPRRMASRYIALYEGAIQQLEDQLNALQNADPPAPPAQIAAVQQELDALRAELEPKIEELHQFREPL